MNTVNNKNQIDRIVNTLMTAYRIQPEKLVSNNEFVKKVTYEEDTREWVRQSLLNPDKKLAECILPILVDRFEARLNNCGSNYDK